MKKNNKKRALQAQYYEACRRMDEQGGGDHTLDLLIEAAHRGDLDLLKYIAGLKGVDYQEAGKTALFWIAGSDDLRAAELLLQAGANPNAAEPGAASPLMHAAKNNRIEMARLLIQHGAAVDNIDASFIGSLVVG